MYDVTGLYPLSNVMDDIKLEDIVIKCTKKEAIIKDRQPKINKERNLFN